jgi:hypothetical protein
MLSTHLRHYHHIIETAGPTACAERFCDVDGSGLDDHGLIPGRAKFFFFRCPDRTQVLSTLLSNGYPEAERSRREANHLP